MEFHSCLKVVNMRFARAKTKLELYIESDPENPEIESSFSKIPVN